MQHSTALASRPNDGSVASSTHLSDPDAEGWRRPACSESCTSRRVLVADGAYRGWRDLVMHDHAAYERTLESTVLALAGRPVRPQAAPIPDPTVAALLALVAGLATRVETGRLVVDLLADTVELDGRRLVIGPVEWDLLVLLALRKGSVVSYDELAAWIWPAARLHQGRPRSGQPSRQSLRSAILRLRAHLGDAGDLVATVRDQGCMLREVAPECLPWGPSIPTEVA